MGFKEIYKNTGSEIRKVFKEYFGVRTSENNVKTSKESISGSYLKGISEGVVYGIIGLPGLLGRQFVRGIDLYNDHEFEYISPLEKKPNYDLRRDLVFILTFVATYFTGVSYDIYRYVDEYTKSLKLNNVVVERKNISLKADIESQEDFLYSRITDAVIGPFTVYLHKNDFRNFFVVDDKIKGKKVYFYIENPENEKLREEKLLEEGLKSLKEKEKIETSMKEMYNALVKEENK